MSPYIPLGTCYGSEPDKSSADTKAYLTNQISNAQSGHPCNSIIRIVLCNRNAASSSLPTLSSSLLLPSLAPIHSRLSLAHPPPMAGGFRHRAATSTPPLTPSRNCSAAQRLQCPRRCSRVPPHPSTHHPLITRQLARDPMQSVADSETDQEGAK